MYEDTPIFLQLSMERAPEWYAPVPVEEVTVDGRKGYRLAGNVRDIWKIERPPWLVHWVSELEEKHQKPDHYGHDVNTDAIPYWCNSCQENVGDKQ